MMQNSLRGRDTSISSLPVSYEMREEVRKERCFLSLECALQRLKDANAAGRKEEILLYLLDEPAVATPRRNLSLLTPEDLSSHTYCSYWKCLMQAGINLFIHCIPPPNRKPRSDGFCDLPVIGLGVALPEGLNKMSSLDLPELESQLSRRFYSGDIKRPLSEPRTLTRLLGPHTDFDPGGLSEPDSASKCGSAPESDRALEPPHAQIKKGTKVESKKTEARSSSSSRENSPAPRPPPKAARAPKSESRLERRPQRRVEESRKEKIELKSSDAVTERPHAFPLPTAAKPDSVASSLSDSSSDLSRALFQRAPSPLGVLKTSRLDEGRAALQKHLGEGTTGEVALLDITPVVVHSAGVLFSSDKERIINIEVIFLWEELERSGYKPFLRRVSNGAEKARSELAILIPTRAAVG